MRKPGRPPYVSRREEAKEGKDYRDVIQTFSYKYSCVFRPLLQDNRALSVKKASTGHVDALLTVFRCSSMRLFIFEGRVYSFSCCSKLVCFLCGMQKQIFSKASQ